MTRLEYAAKRIDELKASNAELLAALQEIRQLTAKRQLPLTAQIYDVARAAIAKVEGGAP